MLLTTLLLFAPVLALPECQHPDPPLQNAVQRELRLYDIGDLVNPTAAMRKEIERDFLRSTLDLALTSQEAELNAAERFALAATKRALEVEEQHQERERLRASLLAANRAGNDFFAQIAKDRQYPFESEEDLMASIETYMVPPFTNSGGSLKFDIHQGRPVLLGFLTKDQSNWLQAFLKYQRIDQSWMANIQVTVLASGKDGAKLPAEVQGARVVDDYDSILKQIDSLQAQGWESISSPSLTLWPWHPGDLSVLNQVSYVSGYSIETVEPGNRQIADPEIDVLQEGLVLGCRVRQVDEQNYGLHLEIDFSELKRPMKTQRVVNDQISEKLNLEISIPDVRTTNMMADVRMKDGSGLLLGAPSADGGRPLVLLVQFHRVEAEPTPEANTQRRR